MRQNFNSGPVNASFAITVALLHVKYGSAQPWPRNKIGRQLNQLRRSSHEPFVLTLGAIFYNCGDRGLIEWLAAPSIHV